MVQLRKFTGVGTGMIVGAVFATIVGVSAHGGDVTKIHACVDGAGNIKIVGASATCKPSETAVDWNIQGVKGDKGDKGDQGLPGAKGDPGVMGPPGTFTGSFTSPNQDYRLTVTDTGIELAGPAARIRLEAGGIILNSALALSVRSTTSMDIKSGSTMLIESAATMDIETGATMHITSDGTMGISGAAMNVQSAGPVVLVGTPVLINGVPQ